VLGLAGAALVAMALPGAASASSVSCSGTVTPTTDPVLAKPLQYDWTCNSAVVSYGITASKELDFFSPDTLVFDSTNTVTNYSYGCEGTIPSNGFGCFANGNPQAPAPSGDRVKGVFETSKGGCTHSRKHPLQTWLSVTTVLTNPITG